MMRSKFWQGLLWGSVMGTMLGAIMGPLMKPQRKPLMERSVEAVQHKTDDLMRQARKVRKRIMKKLD